ncbi:hypothetical protein BLNAU_6109 [Blattamonas nauphoetae]|uniref:Transmembrane protein n=1 Tax=Blattamonas nauphoetae TaxID=2049346 RepID=A0ABQ9Y532_9EUKA|nr:hypothetical protein BLNAU_6109 [Blattamonas nauphoetae]
MVRDEVILSLDVRIESGRIVGELFEHHLILLFLLFWLRVWLSVQKWCVFILSNFLNVRSFFFFFRFFFPSTSCGGDSSSTPCSMMCSSPSFAASCSPFASSFLPFLFFFFLFPSSLPSAWSSTRSTGSSCSAIIRSSIAFCRSSSPLRSIFLPFSFFLLSPSSSWSASVSIPFPPHLDSSAFLLLPLCSFFFFQILFCLFHLPSTTSFCVSFFFLFRFGRSTVSSNPFVSFSSSPRSIMTSLFAATTSSSVSIHLFFFFFFSELVAHPSRSPLFLCSLPFLVVLKYQQTLPSKDRASAAPVFSLSEVVPVRLHHSSD